MKKEISLSDKLKEVSKSGIVYGIGVALNSLIGFILVPIYTSKLSTEEYGIVALIILCGTLMGSIFYFGASSSLVRYYYDTKNENEKLNIINSALFIIFFGALTQIVFGYVFSKILSNLIFDTSDYSNHIIIISFYSSFSFINTTYLILLRYQNKSIQFVILNGFVLVISIFLVLLFFHLNFGLLSPFLGLTIGQILLTLYLVLNFSEYNPIKFSFNEIKKHLKYGLPIAFSSIVFYLLDWIDRFFIKEYCSLNDVGIFSYGAKLAMVIHAMIIIPFSLVWSQMRMKYKEDSNASELFKLITSYFIALCLFIIFIFTLFNKEFILLTSSGNIEYFKVQSIIPIIIIAQFFFGLSNIFDYGIAISNKSYYFLYIGLFALLINSISNYIAVPIWGFKAAAYTKLLSYFIYISIIYLISSRYFKFEIEAKRLILLASTICIILLINTFLNNFSFFIVILIKLCSTLLLSVYIFLFFMHKTEYTQLLIQLKKINIFR